MKKRLIKKYYPLWQSILDDQVDPHMTKKGLKFCIRLSRSPNRIRTIPVNEPIHEWLDHFEDQAHQDFRATWLNPNFHQARHDVITAIHFKNRSRFAIRFGKTK